jgi:hypothetical protein
MTVFQISVVEMMRRARKDVVLTSPYLVPGVDGMETFRNSVERHGVKFTLITNSLAATDEPVVHKLLDALGDLALLPPLAAQVTVIKGSHALHLEAFRQLVLRDPHGDPGRRG